MLLNKANSKNLYKGDKKMFDKKQLDILSQELDNCRIKTRDKGNISLSYIEGHDVIETANKIFVVLSSSPLRLFSSSAVAFVSI